MRSSFPGHFRLSATKIQELIRDVELRKEGAVIHYVPDVHDLADFCFPVNVSEAPSDIDIERISDDQISLFEVFMRRPERPILFAEYENEIEDNEDALRSLAEYAYDKADLLKQFVDPIGNPSFDADSEQAVSFVEKHLNVAIAVVTGLYSIGFARWSDVVNKRLVREQSIQYPAYESALVDAIRSYRESQLCRDMFSVIAELLRNQVQPGGLLQRRLRAAQNDARVIDKVISANKHLEQAYLNGTLSRRHIVVYFASAGRTARMLQVASAKNALPEIGKHRYTPWRDKNQIFASLVLTKGRADSPDELNHLENTLRGFLQLRLTSSPVLHGQKSRPCANCVMEGGSGDGCSSREFCSLSPKSLTEQVRENEAALSNVGLLANIDKYSGFMRERTSLKAAEDVKAFVARLIQDMGVRDLTLERLWSLQYGLFLRSALLQSVNSAPASDVITAASQAFPVALRHLSENYRTLVASMIDYFKLARGLRDERKSLMYSVYLRFNELDRATESFSPEHELIRLLIYIGIEDGGTKGVSLGHARAIRERLRTEAHDQKWDGEFAYMMAWVLRLHGRNHECDEFVSEALDLHPTDARLHHGRLLNAYQWYEEEHAHYSIKQLSALATVARNVYEREASQLRPQLAIPALIDELVAVTCNDVAFVNCFDPQVFDTEVAREQIERITVLFPRADWPANYPEYVHTEAMLLYREASVERSAAKLDEAERKIRSVTERLNTVKACELLEQISELRRELLVL